jgi:hypothetical protein
MSNFDKVAWLPLCAGLTGVGLVLSYLVMRRRGLGSGLRWAAVSLLPLAAYLTGAVKMLWQMGVAIGDFAAGFAFSTKVWSGIAVAGLAVVLFVVSGPLRRRSVRRGGGQAAAQAGQRGSQAAAQPAKGSAAAGALARTPAGGELATRQAPTVPVAKSAGPAGPAGPAGAAGAPPAKARKGKNAGDDDDDFGEVADILRRHGIT